MVNIEEEREKKINPTQNQLVNQNLKIKILLGEIPNRINNHNIILLQRQQILWNNLINTMKQIVYFLKWNKIIKEKQTEIKQEHEDK